MTALATLRRSTKKARTACTGPHSGGRQRGVALVQVLLIFAILVAIAAQLGFRQRLSIAGTQYLLDSGQGNAWLYSVEALALAELQRDFESPLDDDYWGAWSQSFDLEPGEAVFRLHSLQGLYNLNWLHPDSGVPESSEQLSRLLSTQGQDGSWTQRLSDWFDPNSAAEFEYRIRQPGYRPSYLPLADESELRLLEADVIPLSEFNFSDWATFLPTHSRIDLNSVSQAVFLELHDQFSDAEWSALENVRADGLLDIEDWLAEDVMQEFLEDHTFSERWFTTERHYFKLEAEVEYQDRRKWLTSWIYRDSNGTMTIYQRHLMRLPESGLDHNAALQNSDVRND